MNRNRQSRLASHVTSAANVAGLANGTSSFRLFISPSETAGTEKISHAYLL